VPGEIQRDEGAPPLGQLGHERVPEASAVAPAVHEHDRRARPDPPGGDIAVRCGDVGSRDIRELRGELRFAGTAGDGCTIDDASHRGVELGALRSPPRIRRHDRSLLDRGDAR
jgi:hypothetical protein